MTTLLLGNMNYSSWSIRAALVAMMSGSEVTHEVMPLAVEATRDKLTHLTGYRQVPALISGDLVVRDSLAITEWLAEQAEPGLIWPLDALARARARMVTAEMHSGFAALRRQCYVDIRSRRLGTALDEDTRVDIERVLQIWAECRRAHTGDGAFLFGAWSAADAFYAPVVTRFRTYGVSLEGADFDYAQAVLNHPDMLAIEAAANAETWIMAPGTNGMEYLGER